MITYNTEHVDMPTIDQHQVSEWVGRVAGSYEKRVGDVNYIFVDDERILELNRQFVHHDYYTDHIGFDYTEGRILNGDIYISLDTVRTNAEMLGVCYVDELHRVIIHGILHLCGIDDKEPGERELMEAAEDKALSMLQR